MSKHLNYVLESIDAQTRDKFNQLTLLVSQVDITKPATTKPISDFFYSEYGIRCPIELITNPYHYGLHTSALPLSTKSALWSQSFIDMMDSSNAPLLNDDYIEVFVDLKRAKVKMKDTLTDRFKIQTTTAMFDGKIPHDQLAAILLHELGHVFNTLIFAITTHISNQAVERVIRKNKDIEYAVFQNQSHPDLESITTEIFASKIDHVRKTVQTKYYDVRLNEMMADHFATQHGAGLALARAVANPILSSSYFLNHNLTSNTLLGLGIIVPAALLVSPVVAALAVVILSPLFGTGIGSIYEPLPDRIRSIRTDTVALLRNPRMSKEEKKTLINEIDEIDRLLKTIPASIWNLSFFAPSKYLFDLMSGKVNNLKLHKKIEELTNNDLFVAGSRFATLN